MRRRLLSLAAASLAVLPISLAVILTTLPMGCGQPPDTITQAEALQTYDMAEAPPPADLRMPSIQMAPTGNAPSATSPAEVLPVSVPRIAYTYGYAFRLPTGAVAAVQDRHLQLCQRLGSSRCRVVSMQRGEREGEAMAASLSLEVAAGIASEFGRRIADISSESGAETIDRTIAAEDLSRQMIDSEARIRTRETLIRRLTGLLETRSGNIQQAVEAERAINTAQEELEAARVWVAEMRGRVAMSKVEIAYRSREPLPDSRGPIEGAFAQVGTMSVGSIAAMILIAGAILPWLIFAGVALLIVRVVRRRRRSALPDEESAEEPVLPD